MTRRTCVTSIGAALAAGAILSTNLSAKEGETMRELLEACQNDKKSVVLYFKGQNLGGAVVKIATDTVEIRNREYGRIIVRLDALDAVATM